MPLNQSLHARGAHEGDADVEHGAGIITAYAGSAASQSACSRPARDHPRMRGEHRAIARGNGRVQGSSPHARGAQQVAVGAALRAGIIPACAGSTTRRRSRSPRSRDHPRMRGEHPLGPRRHGAQLGSSPHAQGAHDVALDVLDEAGIIPACAGSTRRRRSPRGCSRDHPRMRGEHVPFCAMFVSWVGSSPHARGAPGDSVADAGDDGIIPACAGSTPLVSASIASVRDHPRMRGEHLVLVSSVSVLAGSSPHARGAQPAEVRRPVVHGIIPACAGSTSCPYRSCSAAWDHPRMRGEHRGPTSTA